MRYLQRRTSSVRSASSFPQWSFVRALLGAIPFLTSTLAGDVILVSSAKTPGAAGTEWVTGLQVTNPGDVTVPVTPVLSNQAAGGTEVRGRAFSVPPRSQRSFEDALGTLFPGVSPAFGPIRLSATAPLVVTAYVYTRNASGRVGFSFLGQDEEAGFTSGVFAMPPGDVVLGRTNLILMSPDRADASVDLVTESGEVYRVSLGEGGWRQVNGIEGLLSGSVVTFNSSHRLLVLATAIDQVSGQAFPVLPTFASPFEPPPVVLRGQISGCPLGCEGTEIRTDVCACTSDPVTVQYGTEERGVACDATAFLGYEHGDVTIIARGRSWMVAKSWDVPWDPHLGVRATLTCR
jgi:hypothetical protein